MSNEGEKNLEVEGFVQPNKVTRESIEEKIVSHEFVRIPDTTITICSILMINGFRVIGKSACVDTTKFDKSLGESIAYDDAFNKLWELEGYAMMEKNRLPINN